METRALTIGDFGRRSGLSIKALRLYEVSGLLPPDEVDPVSGYRRYSPGQLDRARRISLLRRLGMPLAVIAEVLAGTDEEAVLRLDGWWAAQEAAMQAKRGSLGWLRAQLAHTGEPDRTYRVHHRTVPTTKIAFIRYDVDQQSLVDRFHDAQRQIRAHLAASGAVTTAEHWLLFHGAVTPDSEAPVEACLPFTGSVEPAGEIAIRLEPGHDEAYVTVTRDDCFFPRIMHAYDTVGAHVAAAGVRTAGPSREIYLAGWHDVGGDDPFVLVAQPVLS